MQPARSVRKDTVPAVSRSTFSRLDSLEMPWNVCYDHLVFGGNTTMMFGKFCPVNKGFTKYACLLATLCLTSPAWANLVQNGNFGTGDFTDWTANSSANHPWLIETAGYDGLDPYPGDTYFAST